MPDERKVCVVTGSRSDYGLLRELMDVLSCLPGADMQLLVTGSHLSGSHGMTIDVIRADGYTVDWSVDLLLASDTPLATVKSMGLGLIGFADAFSALKPDLVVVLGDRYEILMAASACLVLRIPIAHIHGGELTSGAIDEAIRHSVTKMASYHFTSTEQYRQRVVQLGEQPERVFNTGLLAVDAIERMTLLTRPELEEELAFEFAEHNVLVTFHPVTLDQDAGISHFRELLAALAEFEDIHVIFTEANADSLGIELNRLIAEHVHLHPDACVSFNYMGQLRYLSTLKLVDVVIGNSSSGVIEAPVLGTPSVNIGERQGGRLRAPSVVDCPPEKAAIVAAVNAIISHGARHRCDTCDHPFGNTGAARRIADKLLELPLEGVLVKPFHDLEIIP